MQNRSFLPAWNLKKEIAFSSSRIFINPRCHQAENLQTQLWLFSAKSSEECPIQATAD